uniref:Uncharacterized protein n=1 Tax=Knipowitschia caucasica TaxID=637954 RepID=A0AAV2KA04_KNICA
MPPFDFGQSLVRACSVCALRVAEEAFAPVRTFPVSAAAPPQTASPGEGGNPTYRASRALTHGLRPSWAHQPERRNSDESMTFFAVSIPGCLATDSGEKRLLSGCECGVDTPAAAKEEVRNPGSYRA